MCGQSIEEDAYQRFFYSSEEYMSILKSKQKNVETVRDAKEACAEQYSTLEKDVAFVEKQADSLRRHMQRWAGTEETYGTALEQIDDLIVDARVELAKLRQQYDLELERDRLEKILAATRAESERLRIETQKPS